MNINSQEEELAFLKNNGFPVSSEYKKVASIKEVWHYFLELDSSRKSLNYGVDGLVVKINNNTVHSTVGSVGKTPRAWCALKFSAEESTTTINSVTWQVGRTGKITPVAEMNPVLLAGTTVSRATLHNAQEVNERQLHIHDMIVIRKAGDIIPEITSILTNLRKKEAERIELPLHCPSCGSLLDWSQTGTDLMCFNSEACPQQILSKLSYYSSRKLANIEGLSEKSIQKFVELFSISEFPDLYDLPFETIQNLEGFGSKSVSNLKTSIQNSRNITDTKFLAGLSIDGVGLEVSELINKTLRTSYEE